MSKQLILKSVKEIKKLNKDMISSSFGMSDNLSDVLQFLEANHTELQNNCNKSDVVPSELIPMIKSVIENMEVIQVRATDTAGWVDAILS